MSNETGPMSNETIAKIRREAPKAYDLEKRLTGRAILEFLKEHSDENIHIVFKPKDD